MSVNGENYHRIIAELAARNVQLIAVSKTKPAADIQQLYDLGQRDFGENYVQELVDKAAILPDDVRWHFIGHLQTNKVKYIAPFVHLIHGVDSLKLLSEIQKQAVKTNRVLSCLLQVHISGEATKFGMDDTELAEAVNSLHLFPMVRVRGLMGMASFTDNGEQIRQEFARLNKLYREYPQFDTLSMGMSSDYQIAVEEGSTMVRIGSLLFGARVYKKED